MIGRKILDRIDENLLSPKSHSKNEARTGLRIAGLRINTGHVVTSTGTLLNAPKDRITPTLSAVTYTPNTSLTFGRPNPTTVLNSPMSESSGASVRRQQRYSRAEKALANTLQQCKPEPSPQDLQIRALEQATALLSVHAHDAQERATRLRNVLSDKEIDPENYIAYQRERWMEERRQFAATSEVKELSQHLASLKVHKDDRDLGESGQVGVRILGKTVDSEAKRHANLARFFELSPTRTTFGTGHKDTLMPAMQSSRRMTMSDVSPLRLRPTSVVTPIQKFARAHARSISLGSKPPVPTRSAKRPAVGGTNRGSLTMVAEDVVASNVVDSSVTSTPPLSPTSNAPSSSSTIVTQPSENGGVATIYAPVMPRSTAEILSDLRDEVEIPSYAMSLLEDFDLIHDDIRLPPVSLTKQRAFPPRSLLLSPPGLADTPAPSEESDTGPYTSFALPSPASSPSPSSRNNLPFQTPPQQRQHSLMSPDYSNMSGSSTPSTPGTPKLRHGSPSRNPLLSLIHGRKDMGGGSPASSRSHVDGSSLGSRRRFGFFSRK
ncbi:hypothetical protein SERLA73DRAFT_182077 [Serpula lacrymans var. lacrymans S7.3]|uniref:Uncharacterized protein n=2 Tax=Serpula lacrymans var. lacrymans TaxID=341189 RepID=F8PZ85_SERL3|nr:uncharacterized protein SERLADRAFT_468561 [Serpula lacrymans var. lacrymans S7.9]EGN99198.1 hypothetical protein SERLA73DRAFT_182077 [Serpula lacrymans var. lacrymans S7.3]EGO24766.1 hypothetical protein SERLADRAFT_468561 [Serpula lacrymans var. lacrymans S7.9]